MGLQNVNKYIDFQKQLLFNASDGAYNILCHISISYYYYIYLYVWNNNYYY